MAKKYSHILSPLRINNTVLKTRMCFPCAPVHFLNGPEKWPSEGYMAFYTNMAKNGCAYINMGEWDNPTQRTVGAEDSIRMEYFDTTDPSLDNYFSQLADDVRYYGSMLNLSTRSSMFPEGYSFMGGPGMGGAPGAAPKMTEMATTEMVYESIENYAKKMKKYQKMGYGMAVVSVGGMMGGGPGGPGGQRKGRTDEWADMTKYNKALLKRVKEVCGKDFLLETIVAGDGMMSPEQLGELSKEYEGLVDIWTLREPDDTKSHATSFTFKKYEHGVVGYARRMKAVNPKAIIGINGGFQDLDEIDGYIADGTCDLISMGRAFFADAEYYQKAVEGRGEDVTPCIWCNKCHGTMDAPWITFCSVNPVMGNQHKLHRMTPSSVTPRKVAVVGGGTAGMTAAYYAARNGHDVTLYEKTDTLGGQLLHAVYADFKWSIKDFMDWQIRMLDKYNVKVVMNHAPTADELEAEGFYGVIAATGARANIPAYALDENGSRKAGMWTCMEVFGHESELGKKVVVVGGSETGIETAMYLGEAGHDVTVLTRQNELAYDAPKLHYITMSWSKPREPGAPMAMGPMGLSPEWEKPKYNGLVGITGATTLKVTPNSVTYKDAGGEHTIDCDGVVICGGMIPNQEDAVALSNVGSKFLMAGDVELIGNIQKCTRSGFAKAMQI